MALALVLPVLDPTGAGLGAPAVSRSKVLGWGFNLPSATVSSGHRLYVANLLGDTIDLLGLANGSLARWSGAKPEVWYGPQHGFSSPSALALDGGTLWILGSPAVPYSSSRHRLVLTALDASSGKVERVVTIGYVATDVGARSLSSVLPTGNLAVDGPDLFVSSPGADEVFEVTAATGHLVRAMGGPRYGLSAPSALAVMGSDLFVANRTAPHGGSVTEVDTETGALVRVISGHELSFANPDALVASGPDLFVVNAGKTATGMSANQPPGSVTELDTYASPGPSPTTTTSTTTATSTGATSVPPSATTSIAPTATTSSSVPSPTAPSVTSTTTVPTSLSTTTSVAGGPTTTTVPSPVAPQVALVRVISGGRYQFDDPLAAIKSNGQLLVTTEAGTSGALSVINATTGALEEVLERPSCQFASPFALTADGTVAFIISEGAGVTEVRSGRCALADEGSPYGFDFPGPSTLASGRLFVANELSGPSGRGSVTEVDARTGALVRVIAEPARLFADVVGLAVAGGDLYVVGGFGEIVDMSIATGTVKRTYNLPYQDVLTGVALHGRTLYMTLAQGGLLALSTATGRVRQLVGKPTPPASFESYSSSGLPSSVVFFGDDLFYLAPGTSRDGPPKGDGSLKEVDVVTGKLVRTITGPSHQLAPVAQMLVWRDKLFVVNPGVYFSVTSEAKAAGGSLSAAAKPPVGSLTEVNARTGALIRVMSGARLHLEEPGGIAALGDELFVADTGGNAVSELNAGTGKLVGVMSNPEYEFDSPEALATYGDRLFVVNTLGDSITDISLRRET